MFKLFGHLSPLLAAYLSPILGMSMADGESFVATLSDEVKAGIPEEVMKDPAVAKFKNVGEVLQAARQGGKPWIETLPKELQEDPNIAKYKTAEEFAKGHVNLAKLVSAKGVIIPGKDATPEEWDKYYTAAGRPAKPEEYKFTPLENLHPTLKVTPEGEAVYKAIAHKAGLNTKQADIVQQEYAKLFSAGLTAQEQNIVKAAKQAETQLRQEWGGEYDRNIALAKRLVNQVGGKDAIAAFGDLGNNSFVLKFLANVGKMFSEDNIGRLGVSSLETNASQAKAEIDKINNMSAEERKNHPYWNETHKDHNKALKHMRELYKISESGGA